MVPSLFKAQAWLLPVTTFSVVFSQFRPQIPAGQLQVSAPLSSLMAVPPF
jgi:hypothetical protein